MGIDYEQYYEFSPKLNSSQVDELIRKLREKNFSPRYDENRYFSRLYVKNCNLETLKEIIPDVLIISECCANRQNSFTEILRKLSNEDEYFLGYDGPWGEDIYITTNDKTFHIHRYFYNEIDDNGEIGDYVCAKECKWTDELGEKYTINEILNLLEKNGVDINQTCDLKYVPQCTNQLKILYNDFHGVTTTNVAQ